MRYSLSHLLIITLIAGLACFIVQPLYFPRYESAWVGHQQDCPKRVFELIEQLKNLPRGCRYGEFVSTMKSHGFDVERDHFKDSTAFWIIDGPNLQSRSFLLSLTLWPTLDGEVIDASISERPKNGERTEI